MSLVVGALRRWLRRRGRTPRPIRWSLALVLATLGLVGIATPASSGAGDPAGGPPDAAANAPAKSPEPPGASDRTTRFPTSPALIDEGRSLYENGCSSCHGTLLEGRTGMGPALAGVGAGPVDFYLSTGRMPLQNPRDEPERVRPAYDRRQINALVAFVTATGGGPPAPAADPAAGDLAVGFHQFTANCAGCHQIVARGGLTLGAFVPNLQSATAQQIAEAVRMGPYLMPHFDSHQIDQRELDSIVRYLDWTRHPDNAGGWGIGNIGPIPEGMAAWFIAVLAMLIVARLIGERVEGASR
jgi:ubiquinol-cytochrome c reductase cytochrome c subunit